MHLQRLLLRIINPSQKLTASQIIGHGVQHWKATLDFSTVRDPRAEKPVPSDFNLTNPVGRESFELEDLPCLVVTATGVLQTKQVMGASSSSLACCFPDGRRNFLTQLRHRTWPHFSAMTGFRALERVLRHEGQVL